MVHRLLLTALLLYPGARLAAQRVTEVRLVRAADGATYRFTPAEITVRPGEVVEFRVESGGPYVLAFEATDLGAADQRLLSSALGDFNGGLRAPTLTGPGKVLRLEVPTLHPGTYRFRTLTHVAYRMEGRLVVRSGGSSRAPE